MVAPPQILVWIYDVVGLADVFPGALLHLTKMSGLQSGSPPYFISSAPASTWRRHSSSIYYIILYIYIYVLYIYIYYIHQPEQGEVLNLELLGGDVELGAVGGDPDPSFNAPL